MPKKRPENLDGRLNHFAREYAATRNGTKAAIAAGYSHARAKEQACDLLAMPRVQEPVAKIDAELTERTNVSKEWVVQQTVHTYCKALEWENPAAARGCLHLLSLLHGYIVEKKDVRIITSVEDLSNEELAVIAGTVIEGEAMDPIEPEGSG
jgi:predicted transcriptional regulator